MEKERTNALEMAAQAHEERKAQEEIAQDGCCLIIKASPLLICLMFF